MADRRAVNPLVMGPRILFFQPFLDPGGARGRPDQLGNMSIVVLAGQNAPVLLEQSDKGLVFEFIRQLQPASYLSATEEPQISDYAGFVHPRQRDLYAGLQVGAKDVSFKDMQNGVNR